MARSDVRVAIDAFRRIVQALRMSNRDAERGAGLSAAQLFALHQLADHRGASINELAALTFTDQSSVSVVVKRLIDRGFVTRSTARDRRRARLCITASGRSVLRRAPEPVQERLIAAITALAPRRRTALAAALDEIARDIMQRHRRTNMFFEDGHPRRHTGNKRDPRTRIRVIR
jgi:MarR family transcriptional regulator, lower aerobic nicotinate degradation pathway regulator